MKRSTMMRTLLPLSVIVLLAIIGLKFTESVSASYSGAIYTTLADGLTVNQNLYDNKEDVYLNGGPQNANGPTLPTGTYFYQVTTPNGVLLSTDNAECRQLQVANGVVSGSTGPACKHANGTFNPVNGSTPVQLVPFDNTTNAGGEYKVWMIRTGNGTGTSIDPNNPKVILFTNSNAKTDNFKVKEVTCTDCDPTAVLMGTKFYDTNADSTWDAGEPPIQGFKIEVTVNDGSGPLVTVVETDANGKWTLIVPFGATYSVRELLPCVDSDANQVCDPGSQWVQTFPVADSQGFQGYRGTVNSNMVSNLDFGNICTYPGSGGLTLGYWSNKNGEKTMNTGGIYGVDVNVYPVFGSTDNPPNPNPGADGAGMTKDLAFLTRLNLKESGTSKKFPDGANFDPANYTGFRTWLLNGNAVNMSYMLSVQLSATSLDVRHKFLADSQLVDARNVCNSVGSCFGFITIGEVRALANQSLNDHSITVSGDPWRDSLEQMKNFLDAVNNNRLNFVSGSACSILYPPPAAPLP